MAWFRIDNKPSPGLMTGMLSSNEFNDLSDIVGYRYDSPNNDR